MTEYSLVDIPWVEEEWQIGRRIKALSVNGRCRVLEALQSWEESSSSDFNHVLSTFKVLAQKRDYMPRKRTRRCIGYAPLFEVKHPGGGKARVFCFQLEEDAAIVACGTHWKDPKRQEADMKRAFILMKDFLNSRGRDHG